MAFIAAGPDSEGEREGKRGRSATGWMMAVFFRRKMHCISGGGENKDVTHAFCPRKKMCPMQMKCAQTVPIQSPFPGGVCRIIIPVCAAGGRAEDRLQVSFGET